MKPYGIQKHTMLVAVIPILVMAVLLESYLVSSRFADLEIALRERSQLLAHQLAASSEYAVFSNNTALLKQNVDAVLSQKDVSRVVVLDTSGNPLVDATGGESTRYETLLKKANISTPYYQDGERMILYEPIIATQVKLNDLDPGDGLASAAIKPLGAVTIEISKHRLRGQKIEVLLFSLAIILIILLVALLLAFRAARRFSHPIIEMSETIHSFGEGNLDARIPAQTEVLELDKLTRGFNQMAQKLQHQQEILETRVAERTAALAASENESRTLIEHSPDMIVRYDRELRRTYVNPAFCALDGGDMATLSGQKPSEYPGGTNSAIYETYIKRVFATGENTHFELKWIGADGKEICSHIRLIPECDSSGAIISVLGVGRDITELHNSRSKLNQANEKLEQMNVLLQSLATSDTLTNLPNRRFLNDRLSQAMALSKRSGCYGALMFLDLDNFKPVNDAHGHKVGDLLLIEAANRLRGCVREMDTVARFGGDEFVVMLSELDADITVSTTLARVIAEKIHRSLSAPYRLTVAQEGQINTLIEHCCTASIGVTLFLDDKIEQDDLLKQADAAMYQAKEAGRNQIRFYAELV